MPANPARPLTHSCIDGTTDDHSKRVWLARLLEEKHERHGRGLPRHAGAARGLPLERARKARWLQRPWQHIVLTDPKHPWQAFKEDWIGLRSLEETGRWLKWAVPCEHNEVRCMMNEDGVLYSRAQA